MGFMKPIGDMIFAVGILIIVLWSAIEIPTYNINFYKSQFSKNNTCEVIGISERDIEKVTYIIIDYLKGIEEELNVNVSIKGEYKPFYNQKELDHMADVKNLFSFFITLRNLCVFYCIAYIAFYLYKKISKKTLLLILRNTFAAFLSVAAVLIVIISFNFNYCFNVFHEIFFTNDLWILNPATDNLINLVPLEFFISISTVVGVIFVAASVGVILLSAFFSRI